MQHWELTLERLRPWDSLKASHDIVVERCGGAAVPLMRFMADGVRQGRRHYTYCTRAMELAPWLQPYCTASLWCLNRCLLGVTGRVAADCSASLSRLVRGHHPGAEHRRVWNHRPPYGPPPCHPSSSYSGPRHRQLCGPTSCWLCCRP